MHVADQQLSKQRGIDAAETLVMENASQVLAGQLDVTSWLLMCLCVCACGGVCVCAWVGMIDVSTTTYAAAFFVCVLRLGGSVSQTGSSSSSAECLKLQQMIEQMQIYQSALVSKLQASGQDLPSKPPSLDVPALEDAKAAAEIEAAPFPEFEDDDDMDGESMRSENKGDSGEAEKALDGSDNEVESDQEEDASMHGDDGMDDEDAGCPEATKVAAKPDKTKIVEDDPMTGKSTRLPARASQPSSQPIFAPESIASSAAVEPAARPPAASAMEPATEEVVNSRTHKREYMVLVAFLVDYCFWVGFQFSSLGFQSFLIRTLHESIQ